MKIICIEAAQYPSLTKGKEYKLEAIITASSVVMVTDDNKEVRGFPLELFENLEFRGL